MPLSKRRDAERKRQKRRHTGLKVMSSADVRAIRRAGLKPEDIGDEAGNVSSAAYYTLLRDRDAIRAHLDWHHKEIGKPDIGTIVEQLQEQTAQLRARVTLLEANQVVFEAQEKTGAIDYEVLTK